MDSSKIKKVTKYRELVIDHDKIFILILEIKKNEFNIYLMERRMR